MNDLLKDEVRCNIHTSYVVAIGSGGTIEVYVRLDDSGPFYGIPGCMIIDFYQDQAELLYIDKGLDKHHEFIGDNGFSIKVVNLKDGPYLYLLKDDEYFEKPVKTSVRTFEEDIKKVWNYYINESYLIYVEKRQI
ncbi:MAG: hypothetical protein J5965_26120 [Aeriscardovia sp.]|nr:hypothetical protein [Aeriscardovia sp.]